MKPLHTAALIILLIVSFLQIIATIVGMNYWGVPKLLIFIFFWVGGIPILGTIAAIVGAIHVWHWSIIQALLLFIVPWIVVIALAILDKENSK